ncbi:DUF2235 domain-containing protein [Martelella mangrovi]|uniref:T6SS Phospholipase effector Tle1-like catalytic domain-containing protein n=1 Tax=Martelella mangrovi TaxID=1397477 RepID=A0ABV2I6K6_9HYPH
MTNLVVCCDGTWNTPDQTDRDLPAPSNVVKLYSALSENDADGNPQKKYYHPGVGSEGNWWERLSGGGMGVGLDENIKSAYKWLAVNYSRGDRIYAFGFSRGAFTARSLAGLIVKCGLLDLSDAGLSSKEIWRRVDDVYEVYRGRSGKPYKTMKFYNTKAGANSAGKTPIWFLGVWDTVGALGIPDDLGILDLLDKPENHRFHDTSLSDKVINARHALAIDEHRQTFTPTMWTNVEDRETARQLWFPGAHGDVGGGYIENGLSDGALAWMMDEASGLHLSFRTPARDQVAPDYLDVAHNTVKGIYEHLKTRPRSVSSFLSDTGAFHESATNRQENPPLSQPDYWPTRSLQPGERAMRDIFAAQKWNATGLFLEKGKRYRFSAQGEWKDADIKCGPGGTKDGNFYPGEVLQLGASALGKLEGVFKWATGRKRTDFLMTKRLEGESWFALIGVIANGIGADKDGAPNLHQEFLIGEGPREIKPESDGYLYCFTNDAWAAYGNNKGSVALEAECVS